MTLAKPAQPGFDRLCTSTDASPQFSVFRSHAGTRSSTHDEQALFGASRLSVLERTLKSGTARAALDQVILPEFRAAALPEDAPVDLPEILASLDLAPARIDDHLSAALTSMGDSVALSTDRHTALLVLTRTARNAEGTALARQILRIVPEFASYAVTLGG